MKAIKTLGERWNRFWFEPTCADNLGLCRIILYGSMFLFYVLSPLLFKSWGWHEDFTLWGSVSSAFWNPVWLFRLLHLPQVSTGVLILMQSVWHLALALSCIGLFTRFSTALSLILGTYLFGLPNNFGKIHHLDQILLWAFLVMAFSRCGDAWSCDALIRKARAQTQSESDLPVSGEYTWPIHLIWVISAMAYVEAGASKLRHSGISWVTSATMQNYLLQALYHVSDSEPLTSWASFFGRSHWLSSFLAAISLFFEIAIAIALFSRRSRWVLVPGVVGMQAGIALLMGPNFYQMILCQALWVPWDRAVQKVLNRFENQRQRYSLVFDGGCGFCHGTVAVLKSLDVLQRVEFLDSLQQWPRIKEKFPGLDQERAHAEMHVQAPSGRTMTGFYAYRSLAWALPLGWFVLPVFYLPGVASLGSYLYRIVASRRNRVCDLPVMASAKKN